MDERDWRIAELETALKKILKLEPDKMVCAENHHLIDYLINKEVKDIACIALYGGPNDCE